MENLTTEKLQEANDKINRINLLYNELFTSSNGKLSIVERFESFEKEINNLKETAEKRVEELNDFYNIVLVDNKDKKSTKSELEVLLKEFEHKNNQLSNDFDIIQSKKQNQLILIDKLSSFYNQVYKGTEEKISIKESIELYEKEIFNLKETAEKKVEELNDFYNTTLIDDDDKKSTKSELNNLLNEFEQKKNQLSKDSKIIQEKKQEQLDLIDSLKSFYNKLYNDTDEEDSIEKQLKTFIKIYEDKNSEITQKQNKLNNFYEEVFKGDDDKKSLKDEFNFCLQDIKKQLSNAKEELSDLSNFHDKVIDKEDEDGAVKYGLSSIVTKLESRLNKLIKDAEDKLHAITDSSLHNAFAVRADEYTKEFKKLQKFTFLSILGLVLDLLLFGCIQIGLNLADKPFNYNLLIYQFSIGGALFIAIWMFNRNQKMAKKLAEEYHHKASISEAMTGYRTLYGLEHEDNEYQALFNSIKDQLNINPSKHIDAFLKLKSPQEEVSSIVGELLSPKNLGKLAEQLKPFLEKTKS